MQLNILRELTYVSKNESDIYEIIDILIINSKDDRKVLAI